MWALTTYFNPVGYNRRLSNYRIFRSKLSVPLVTVELSFDGQFELTRDDADVLIQLSGGAVLWQKERLLNIAIKSVPQHVSTVAYVDCDIFFEREDWAEEAEKQLSSRCNIVQLFSSVIYLNAEETSRPLGRNSDRPSIPGLVAVFKETGSLPLDRLAVSGEGNIVYNPGLAWAAKKEMFANGFFDQAIIGAGDLYMAHAMFGTMDHLVTLHAMNEPRRRSYFEWAKPFHRRVNKKVGYVEGEICHLWHGDTEHRNYKNRFKVLADFDPLSDIYVGDNGAWEWTDPKSVLAEKLRAHFVNRREDG